MVGFKAFGAGPTERIPGAASPPQAVWCDNLAPPGIVKPVRNDKSSAWAAVGETLRRLGDLKQALRVFELVVAESPRCVEAHFGIGRTRLALGDPRGAIPHLQAAVERQPDHEVAHQCLGDAFHLIGDVERGWEAHARYYTRRATTFTSDVPRWDGSSLQGKSILLWSDQGRGDTIQFLRYTEAASAAGGRVVVDCHYRGLLPLIASMRHVDRAAPRGEPWSHVDFHAPLLYFPAFIPQARASAASHIPYFSVQRDAVSKWRTRLRPDGRCMVGLVWGGNREHQHADSRFFPLSVLAPLSQVNEVRLISLQHGPQASEAREGSPLPHLEQFENGDLSIADVAALILCLDLVISVDTMAAHLAGALGKPVWTLIRHASNWRWRIAGERTDWYPSMRLFRQSLRGDWSSVVADVVSALRSEQFSLKRQRQDQSD